jgi:hypothetical protein
MAARTLGRGLYREWKHLDPFLHVPEQAMGISNEGLMTAFQGSALKQIEIKKEIAA